MTPLRRNLFRTAVVLAVVLLVGALYSEHLRGLHGKEWTMERVPSIVLPLSYPLSLITIGLAFTGRSWYRLAAVALSVFALLCWIDVGVVP